MSLYYEITEFSTSIKPWVFEYLFRELSPRSVTYIDPDIQFFSSLESGVHLGSLNEADCMLTPHILTDSLNDSQQPTLKNIRACGTYNFGFVHFENTSKSREVIGLWARELIHNSLVLFEENLFTDQRYGDLFPALCSTYANRSPALNVAYWNIQERAVYTRNDGKVMVRLLGSNERDSLSEQLIFFHFSSLQASGSLGISKHMGRNPRTPRGANKTIERLTKDYSNQIESNKRQLSELSIAPSVSRIGCIGYEVDGKQYTHRLSAQERRILNRFYYDRSNSGRLDLPPSRFQDENAFLLALHGVESRRSTFVSCPHTNTFGALDINLHDIDLKSLCSEEAQDCSTVAEINVVGYANFSFGIGRITGLVLKGIANAGVRFSFTLDPAQAKPVVETDLAWLESLPGLAYFNENAPSLFLVNADQHLYYMNSGLANHCLSKVCNLGYWWWELETPAPVHSKAAPYLDRVLAPTRFIYESLKRVIDSNKLVYAPLDYQELYTDILSEPGSSHDVLPDQEFLWSLGLDLDLTSFKTLTINVFDFNSCVERKNPRFLVDIFSDPSLSNHALILKASGGTSFPDQYQGLIDQVASKPNVFLLVRRLPQSDLRRLFELCQIYASSHRAEGLGLNIIEADAFGLATVYTDYGGITDYPFYGPGPHYPCASTPVEISSGSLVYSPYLQTLPGPVHWADPDKDTFMSLLQKCMEKTTERAVNKSSGQLTVRSTSIIDYIARLIQKDLTGPAAYRTSVSPSNRAPAALAVTPTLGAAKRQLYLAIRDLLLISRQGYIALKHLLNVIRHIGWLFLRERRSLRSIYHAIKARRHYTLKPPSFRKLDAPPAE
jgi:glycosyltransferase involved in cell wall biosynthesis